MRTRRQPVVRGQRHDQWACGQSFHLEISVRRSRAHESDVHGSRLDSSHLEHRVQGVNFDLDLTMNFVEATQDSRNAHEGGPRGTRNRETISLGSYPPGGQHRTIRLREHLPRMFEKLSTSGRQAHPPFRAVEQPDLELFLQLFDLLAERRLRDVEAFGSATEM